MKRIGRSALLLLACFLAGCASQRQVTEIAPPTGPGGESADARRVRLHVELAAGYYARAQYDVALEELNEALRLDANSAPAHNVLGLVYTQLKEIPRAEGEFQRAVQLAPSDGEIRNNYGWFLCETGREKQALEQFDLAVRNPLYRTPELALVNAGACANRTGNVQAAEDYYSRVLKTQPGNVAALVGLTDIAYHSGRYEQARNHLQAALLTPVTSPKALLLGVCIERKLGDRQSELSFMQQLYNRNPDSPEAVQLRTRGCD
jgi:type IV pilus assembly protein PilF